MTVADFFADITKRNCPSLTEEKKTDISIQSFFSNCIKANLPNADVVIGWHEILIKYIKDPEAIYFIRRYSSGKDKNNDWDIRRGFLTEYDNAKYVFVDNFFSQYFYAMAYNGFVPDYDDFKQFILERKIPYGYSVVSLELNHQAYKRGATYPLNKNGWKLSHVFSANQNDYNFNYKQIAVDLFPKGEYNQFKKQLGSSYPYRKIHESVSEEAMTKIKAHFLRVVHPINHFLTPMIKYQYSTEGINDIGENKELISYMKCQLQDRYGKTYTDYKKLIMAADEIPSFPSFSSSSSSSIGLDYGMSVSKLGSKRNEALKAEPSPKMNYTDSEIANSIRAYLIDGYSLRDIENEILELDYKARGGGWIAKTLLNSKGVDSSMKKIFKGKTIEEAICESDGSLKDSLRWMKDNLDGGNE